MRYTTLIDITQCDALYTNTNIRLVYLHLVLKAGYHDHDKDIVNTSIRRLAADVGISVSATRHAIKQLAKYKMVNQAKGVFAVRKWCPEQPITTRQKLQQQKQQQDAAAAAAAERRAKAKLQREEEQRRAELKAQGKSSLDVYKDMLRQRAADGDAAAIDKLNQLGE